MEVSMAEEKEVDLFELADLCTPWCVHVAATLRIANLIAEGKGEIGELAAAAGCDRHALYAVLGTLASKGVFVETAPGRFALNRAARALLEPGVLLGLDLNGFGGRMARAWSTLLDYVRSGKPAYATVFGLPFWEDLAAHPHIQSEFDALMAEAGHGTPRVEFSPTGGWESARSVVDVGGGTGALLVEILRPRPWLRGVLVDLPAAAVKAAARFAESGLAERARVAAQSFFDPLPAGEDVYLLKSVLNDWPDREVVQILRRCAEAAGETGRVLSLSGAGPDGAPQRLVIEMVLLGGRTRPLGEFRALAGEAGLKVAAAAQQGEYYVVECKKKSG
jgi:SAM-dependent methyltransferase